MQATFVPGYGTLYTGRPGFNGFFAQNDGDFRVRIRINQAGLRNAAPVTRADRRIWVVGDSLSFGWGVARERSFTAILAREAGQGTYNVASPGSDVCGYQALVARMPDRLAPSAVVVGLVMENDIADYPCPRGAGSRRKPSADDASFEYNLSGAKIYLMKYSALYNFFAVSVKRVDIALELLTTLGLIKRPHAYRGQFDTTNSAARADSSADEIAYLKSMLPAGTPFAVLIVPARFDIRDGDPAFADLRTKVVAALARRGIEIIDPYQGFRAAGFAATHFAHDGHWSPRGHEIAAKYLAAWVRNALPRNGAGRAPAP
jgi:hypothetical protein